MDKEMIEKMFDETFKVTKEVGNYILVERSGKIKDFIFETIIPNVLNSIDDGDYEEEFNLKFNKLIKLKGIGTDDIYSFMNTFFKGKQLKKAKELYGIYL